MRHKNDILVILAVSGFALTGAMAMAFLDSEPEPEIPIDALIEPVTVAQPSSDDAGAWFQSIKQYCNPVEVVTQLRWQPAPDTEEGKMYSAACYALAGRIDEAREVIQSMPQDRQYHAAGVVFNVGHPAADAGDDLAAGPLMELVVEFWPNHYMALYHAGAAAYERGEHLRAADYLERFLVEYSVEDGWRSNAKSMLQSMKMARS